MPGDGLRQVSVEPAEPISTVGGVASRAWVIAPLGVDGHVARALQKLQGNGSQSVADVLERHVTFELKCIDRMCLNAVVPSLQTGAGFV